MNSVEVNRGNLTLRSTDVFTVKSTDPGAPPTADIKVRLRTSGQFGASDLGDLGQVVTPSARSRIAASWDVTVLDGTGSDATVRPDMNEDSAVILVGVDFAPALDLWVNVGGWFNLLTVLSLALGISGETDDATGGAAFGNSALVSFDLPEGIFITSERGYSQGLPAGPIDPSVIPLPAGGWLLLSALVLMGRVLRRRVALTA